MDYYVWWELSRDYIVGSGVTAERDVVVHLQGLIKHASLCSGEGQLPEKHVVMLLQGFTWHL